MTMVDPSVRKKKAPKKRAKRLSLAILIDLSVQILSVSPASSNNSRQVVLPTVAMPGFSSFPITTGTSRVPAGVEIGIVKM